MLLKFSDIVATWGLPKGIIHIGAHHMEEREDYLAFGFKNTIWVEANHTLYPYLMSSLQGTAELVYAFAICDKSDEILTLKVTNNGQSSSILNLEKHKIHHPQIHVVHQIDVKSKRMDDLFIENNLNIAEYDFINLDIQGAELLALKGFGELLHDIKYIYTEVNEAHLYNGCALINEVDDYLATFGFRRVETIMTDFEWGDALYIK